MPKTKISEFSATAGNNTDIDGINISEGCAPSGINDAIRELMAQLKDFQAGTAGDSFNGPIGTTTPAAGVFTNLSASGTFALTGDQVQISEGGTGQTTANAAFNALAPSQSTHAGKYLKTDGTNTSWDALDISTADITGTLPIANGGTGLTALGTGVQTALGQNVTGSGGIVLASSPSLTTPNLGTPSAVTLTNATGLPLSTGVTGTLATTNGGTGLTSFTANGVVYASSSSALTTGSALSFDGTNFATTGSINAGSGQFLAFSASAPSASNFSLFGNSSTTVLNGPTGGVVQFNIANSEQMRLTSTGLGIGTSSPTARLTVVTSVNNEGVIRVSDNATYYGELSRVNATDEVRLGSYGPSQNLTFYTVSSERMRITSAGDFELKGGRSIKLYNAANSSTSELSSDATGLTQFSHTGVVRWLNSTATGTLMTLSAAGGLSIGTTTDAGAGNIRVNGGALIGDGTAAAPTFTFYNESNVGIFRAGAGVLGFSTAGTERARFTSGGDLLVGTTAQIGNERFGVDSGSGACGKFKGGTSANVTIDVWNPATTGDNIFVAFRTETAETTRGTITYNRTAGLTAYNTTSDYRAKDIIGPTQNTGATIDALKVYEGKMKGATQARPMMIAHEAQAVVPFCVSGVKDETNEDGTPKYQQMDHASLVPLLIAELQSLRARVAQLEAK